MLFFSFSMLLAIAVSLLSALLIKLSGSRKIYKETRLLTQFLAVHSFASYLQIHCIFASLIGIALGFLVNYNLSVKIWEPNLQQKGQDQTV